MDETPRLADGGWISGPTECVIGDRGCEFIMPVEMLARFMDRGAE